MTFSFLKRVPHCGQQAACPVTYFPRQLGWQRISHREQGAFAASHRSKHRKQVILSIGAARRAFAKNKRRSALRNNNPNEACSRTYHFAAPMRSERQRATTVSRFPSQNSQVLLVGFDNVPVRLAEAYDAVFISLARLVGQFAAPHSAPSATVGAKMFIAFQRLRARRLEL